MEPSRPHACHVCQAGVVQPAFRQLLVEEPLMIELGAAPLVTLMRTVGDETELVLGFLRTEGIVRSRDDVKEVSLRKGRRGADVARAVPADGLEPLWSLPPHRRVFSSCSVCGLEQIQEIADEIAPFPPFPRRLTPGGIIALADGMRRRQTLFPATGAAHAAVLARRPLEPASPEAIVLREDVGRHNALDKAVGAAMRVGLDLRNCVLCLSSRLSFEMVAKAARAGIADVVGVSAPTALAVDLAKRLGMFLAGFVRGETFTVYSGIEALEPPGERK